MICVSALEWLYFVCRCVPKMLTVCKIHLRVVEHTTIFPIMYDFPLYINMVARCTPNHNFNLQG
jgi:hypothetical protein